MSFDPLTESLSDVCMAGSHMAHLFMIVIHAHWNEKYQGFWAIFWSEKCVVFPLLSKVFHDEKYQYYVNVKHENQIYNGYIQNWLKQFYVYTK